MNRRVVVMLGLLGLATMVGVWLVMQFFVVPVATTERLHASNDLTSQTNTDVFTYNLTERTRDASLHLQLEVLDGTANWVLTDPESNVQWSGELAAGQQIDESHGLTATLGEWRLELRFQDTTGRYDTLWEARG